VPRALILLAMLAASAALADPAAAPPAVDPIDVVGRYTATLRWTGCSAPGARAAELELRSVDRALELDLAPAQPGLGAVAVDGDGRRLAGGQADLAVTLAFGKRGVVAFTLALDAGCKARGTLRRASAKIDSCDRLAALARIEAGCAAIAAADRREDVAAVDGELPAWARLRGARKRDAAAACTVRAAVLESALTDAACLALPADAAPIPVPACRDLASLIARLQRCPALPDDVRTQLRQVLVQIATTIEPADRDRLDPTAMLCTDMTRELQEIQGRFGC
jgi:hypothetical protein